MTPGAAPSGVALLAYLLFYPFPEAPFNFLLSYSSRRSALPYTIIKAGMKNYPFLLSRCKLPNLACRIRYASIRCFLCLASITRSMSIDYPPPSSSLYILFSPLSSLLSVLSKRSLSLAAKEAFSVYTYYGSPVGLTISLRFSATPSHMANNNYSTFYSLGS